MSAAMRSAVFAGCARMEIRRMIRTAPWILTVLVFAAWAHGPTVDPAVSNWAGPALGIARLLALAMVLASLWQDAPLRRERFLATRPHSSAATWLAKMLALMVMVVAPLSLADGFAVHACGLGAVAAASGALQSFVLHTLLLAAMFPAVIIWRSAGTGWIAAGIGLAVVIAISFMLLHHPGNFQRIADGRPTLPWSAHWCAASCLLFFLAGGLAMHATRKWNEAARVGVWVATLAVAFPAGLFLSQRQPAPPESIMAGEPSLFLRNSLTGGKTVQSLVVRMRRDETPADGDSFFHFRKIEVNGRNLTPWRVPPPNWTENEPLVRNALARKPGISLAGSGSGPPDGNPEMLRLPDLLDPRQPHHITFEAVESIYQLDSVAVLPFTPGASASIPGSRWEIVESPLPNPHSGTRQRMLCLVSHHFNPLFTAPGNHDAAMDQIMVVDVTRGDRWMPNPAITRDAGFVTRHITPVGWVAWRGDPADNFRVVILRPRRIASVVHHWHPSQPTLLKSIERH